MKPAATQASRGIALVLIAGLLTLLAVAGAGMAAFAVQLRARTGIEIDRVSARLLARSGMEFATARLEGDSRPKEPRSQENQPDDWAFRDELATPLERAINPSYAQTEPYADAPIPGEQGRYTAQTDTYSDLNGNGRFDSWSGRLREGCGAAGETFALKVEADLGRVDVNMGYTGASDVNLDNRPDHNQLGYQYWSSLLGSAYDANPLGQQGAELDSWVGLVDMHRRIADVLNRLGNILGLSDARVGNTILLHRPPGGYASLAPIRQLVSGDDWKKLSPYLSLLPYESAWFRPNEPAGYFQLPLPRKRSLVSLEGATPELLRALIEGLTSYENPLGAPWSIGAADARGVADFLVRNRPLPSSCEVFHQMTRQASILFPGADPMTAAFKVNATWANMMPKSQWGFPTEYGPSGAVTYWFGGYRPPYSWYTYDEPRALFENGERRLARFPPGFLLNQRMTDPPPSPSLLSPLPPSGNHGSLEISLSSQGGAFYIESLGRVEARGNRRSALGRMQSVQVISRSVSARNQVDFENSKVMSSGYFGSTSASVAPYIGTGIPPGRNLMPITVSVAPPFGVSVVGRPVSDRIETHPVFDLDSCPGEVQQKGWAYTPYEGDLRLMDYDGYAYGVDGEAFYLPFGTRRHPLRKGSPPAFYRDNLKDVVRGCVPSSWMQPFSGLVWYLVTPVCCGEADFPLGPNFPLALQSGPDAGTIPRGTLEIYLEAPVNSINSSEGTYLGQGSASGALFHVSWKPAAGLCSPMAQVVCNTLSSAGYYNADDWEFLSFTFDKDNGTHGYVNGVPDPGLSGDYAPKAIAPDQLVFTVRGDEARLFASELPAGVVVGHSRQPRYWVSGLAPPGDWDQTLVDGFKPAPSFVSALYRLPHPATVTGARWDGYVPLAIRQAGGAAPMWVELLLYESSDGTGPFREAVVDKNLYRTGGGNASFPWDDPVEGSRYRAVRSFRYKVWMDASAAGDGLRETPVFDGITVHYRIGSSTFGFSSE